MTLTALTAGRWPPGRSPWKSLSTPRTATGARWCATRPATCSRSRPAPA
jgi:hypothetical protein